MESENNLEKDDDDDDDDDDYDNDDDDNDDDNDDNSDSDGEYDDFDDDYGAPGLKGQHMLIWKKEKRLNKHFLFRIFNDNSLKI